MIRGDIGYRKPSAEACHCLLDRLGATPQLFVDDRPRNITAAQALGIPAFRFGTGCDDTDADFAELMRIAAAIPQ